MQIYPVANARHHMMIFIYFISYIYTNKAEVVVCVTAIEIHSWAPICTKLKN